VARLTPITLAIRSALMFEFAASVRTVSVWSAVIDGARPGKKGRMVR
jgi:hypothetical protein